jgi:hypothetical protein
MVRPQVWTAVVFPMRARVWAYVPDVRSTLQEQLVVGVARQCDVGAAGHSRFGLVVFLAVARLVSVCGFRRDAGSRRGVLPLSHQV